MSIHDDARAAGQAVIDAAIAERDRMIAAREVAIADLSTELGQSESRNIVLAQDVERITQEGMTAATAARLTLAERDALIEQLRARIREFEAGEGPIAAKYGCRVLGTIDEAKELARKGEILAPLTAKWVEWTFGTKTITEVGRNNLGANDLLVLPYNAERGRGAPENTYYIDLSRGFFGTPDVAEVWNGAEIVDGKPKEGTGTRYLVPAGGSWMAGARVRVGILGLGPVEVTPAPTSWRAPQQIRNSADAAKGISRRGQFHVSSTGRVSAEKVGAQEKLIESATDRAYFGNFILRGADLGGVCYGGIATSKVAPTFEYLEVLGGWRSAGVSPNVETPAIGMNNGTGYRVRGCIFDAELKGSTALMVNQGTNGGTVTDTVMKNGIEKSGPAAHYQVTGEHVWTGVVVDNYGGPNIEHVLEGFTFKVRDSDWSKMRADRHISLGYPQAKVIIDVADTTLSPASKGVLGVNRWKAGTNAGNLDNSGISYTMAGAAQPLSIRQ